MSVCVDDAVHLAIHRRAYRQRIDHGRVRQVLLVHGFIAHTAGYAACHFAGIAHKFRQHGRKARTSGYENGGCVAPENNATTYCFDDRHKRSFVLLSKRYRTLCRTAAAHSPNEYA